MQLTKSQVIALFLSAAQAYVEDSEVINSTCSADTLDANASANVIQRCSSFNSCEDNNDCEPGTNEVCATIVKTGDTLVGLNGNAVCLNGGEIGVAGVCGEVGKVNGVAYTISCPALGGVPNLLPVPATLLAAVEGIITEGGVGTWDDVRNMKVSSRYNFQDGWFIRNEDLPMSEPIYTETDKPKINKCTDNAGCGAGECCSYWPDANNKRCITESLGGVEQTIPPLNSWTPLCIAAAGGAPVSAADDLAEEAQASAAQKLNEETAATGKWFDDKAKEDAKYVDMTEEEKSTFNAAQVAKKATFEEESEAALTLAIGEAVWTDAQKAVFEIKYLDWLKAKTATCKEDAKSIACIKAVEIRDKEEADRKEDGYYAKSEEDRAADDTAQEERNTAQKATLTAAWKQANQPAAGEAGSACSKTDRCTTAEHCCGTASPKLAGDEEITGVCADKVSHEFTDALGVDYTHVCGAQRLFAAAGALLAATYLM